MPSNHTVTNSISQQGSNHAVQTITPDYTGVYCFCGTIFMSILLLTIVGYKIWRELKKDVLEFLKELNSNIREYLYDQKH